MTATAHPLASYAVRRWRANRASGSTGYRAIVPVPDATKRVITDDKWICSWDGSRLLVDRVTPRVEVILTPMEGHDD